MRAKACKITVVVSRLLFGCQAKERKKKEEQQEVMEKIKAAESCYCEPRVLRSLSMSVAEAKSVAP